METQPLFGPPTTFNHTPPWGYRSLPRFWGDQAGWSCQALLSPHPLLSSPAFHPFTFCFAMTTAQPACRLEHLPLLWALISADTRPPGVGISRLNKLLTLFETELLEPATNLNIILPPCSGPGFPPSSRPARLTGPADSICPHETPSSAHLSQLLLSFSLRIGAPPT